MTITKTNRESGHKIGGRTKSFVETLKEYFLSEEYEKALPKIEYVRTKLNK